MNITPSSEDPSAFIGTIAVNGSTSSGMSARYDRTEKYSGGAYRFSLTDGVSPRPLSDGGEPVLSFHGSAALSVLNGMFTVVDTHEYSYSPAKYDFVFFNFVTKFEGRMLNGESVTPMSFAVVPEPASLCLTGLAAGTLLRRSRKS